MVRIKTTNQFVPKRYEFFEVKGFLRTRIAFYANGMITTQGLFRPKSKPVKKYWNKKLYKDGRRFHLRFK